MALDTIDPAVAWNEDLEKQVKEIYDFSWKWFGILLRHHQLDWLRFIISGGDFIVLLSPRGHGKSTVIFVYLTWMICKNPKIRIMIIANTDALATNISRAIQRTIENNEDLRIHYGLDMGKPWKAGECFLAGELHPVLNAAATQAKVTGKRFDLCLMDDAVAEDFTSLARLNKFKDWMDGQLLLALDPWDEQVIVVGTRKGVKDWYSELLENPDIEHHVGKAIKEDGSPLWPVDFDRRGFSLEKLAKKKRRNPKIFAQEMMNDPSPPTGYIFNPKDLMIWETLPSRDYLTYAMGVDPGAGLGDRASWFAVSVVAYDNRNKNTYIVEQYRQREHLLRQLDVCKALKTSYEPKHIIVETYKPYAFLGEQFMNALPAAREVNYSDKLLRGTKDVDKEARIESRLAPLFRDHKIYIQNPDYNHFSNIFLTHEYLEFGGGGQAGKGSDMDMLDSLVLAIDDFEYDHQETCKVAARAGHVRTYPRRRRRR